MSNKFTDNSGALVKNDTMEKRFLEERQITNELLEGKASNEELDAERARIDQLIGTEYPSSPTQDNAELLDIRIGADGTKYRTAGDAVRAAEKNAKAYAKKLADENNSFVVVEKLPVEGKKGIIYLIASGKIYNQFMWLESISKFIQIGSDEVDLSGYYDKNAVDAKLEELSNKIKKNAESITAIEKRLSEDEQQLDDLKKIIDGIDFDNLGKEYDISYEDNVVTFTENGEIKTSFTIVGGSGGGGEGSTVTITNLMKDVSGNPTSSVDVLMESETALCSFNFASLDSAGDPTGDGTAKWYVGNVLRATVAIKQGDNSYDLRQFLNEGSNSIRLQVVDSVGNVGTKRWTYNLIDMSSTVSFDDTATYDVGSPVQIRYTANGMLEKIAHFAWATYDESYNEVLDEIIAETVTTSGRQRTVDIPSPGVHGSKLLKHWISAVVNGATIVSKPTYLDIKFVDSSSEDVIISSALRNITITQYNTVNIHYSVFNPLLLYSDVLLKVDGVTVSSRTVDRAEQTWDYKCKEYGEFIMSICCGDVVKNIKLTVNSFGIQIEPEQNDMLYEFIPAGRSNNEADPLNHSFTNSKGETYTAKFTGFRCINDLWVRNDDGVTVCRVPISGKLEIPINIFNNDFRTYGKTIEVFLATRNVSDYDSITLECMVNERGLVIYTQEAKLKSEQSEVSAKFREDASVRLTFVVEPTSENRLIHMYVNGIDSGAVQYPIDDNFMQSSPVGLTIGSEHSEIDVYAIRVYDSSLTRYQVVNNFVADTQDSDTMLDRYMRNDIFNEYGKIVPEKLPNDLDYMIIEAEGLPDYKGDKKTFAHITFVDNSYLSFEADNAQGDVQGTSSAGYRVKNLKIKFKSGFTYKDGSTSGGYALKEGEIPVATFCMKADVASSEGANNVVLVELWEKICPYKTPPQITNSRVRQGIAGRPIVIFWHNTLTGETSFIGKYNFNNDKSTHKTFGFDLNTYPNCECWEFLNNTSNRTLFKSGDFESLDSDGKPAWQSDFEARFPEDYTDASTGLSDVVSWVASTDTTACTNAPLSSTKVYDGVSYKIDNKEYRLAKFKSELPNYFHKKHLIFAYLFTELFLMIDSRAKNMFLTRFRDVWFDYPYDFDTACGINNEGELVFSYDLEDTDTIGSKDVYNGRNSVLWCNLRDTTSFDEFKEVAAQMYANGCTYENVSKMFKDHQSKWSEAIFNEDAYFKYFKEVEETGSTVYLPMAQGKKEAQRDWWLFYRFAYWCSKYNIGEALTDKITLRGYTPENYSGVTPNSDLDITPYASIYATVKYGSYLVSSRTLRGNTAHLICPLDNTNDTEIYIYSASKIASIGDLSSLYVGYCDIATAEKLQEIIIGSNADGYQNTNFTGFSAGNNKLLRKVDFRNCPNLKQAIDLSQCINLEEFYAEGTSITGVTLPVAGIVRILHLPSTIMNLTLRNLDYIEDLSIAGYDNITTLRIESCKGIDELDLINKCSKLDRVRVTDVNWNLESTDLLNRLVGIGGLDESGRNTQYAVITGKCYVPVLKQSEQQLFALAFPNLDITCGTFVSQYKVEFRIKAEDTADGTEKTIDTQYVDRGSNAVDPITREINPIDTPTKASTIDEVFAFGGWDKLLTGVIADRIIYATFNSSTRQYRVRYIADTEVLQDEMLDVYSVPSYKGSDPKKEGLADQFIYYLFSGWIGVPESVTSDVDIYADFVECVLPAAPSDIPSGQHLNDIYTEAEIYAICASGKMSSYFNWGDTIEITLPEEAKEILTDTSIVAKFSDTNHYRKVSDRTQFSKACFDTKGVLNAARRMHSSNSNIGGYEGKELQLWLEKLYSYLPPIWRSMIEPVVVLSSAGNGSADVVESQCHLFPMSHAEMGWDTNAVPYRYEIDSEAERIVSPLYTDNNSRIRKTYNGEGTAQWYWLRSPEPSNSTGFRCVNDNGGYSSGFATYGFLCVAFRFNIG